MFAVVEWSDSSCSILQYKLFKCTIEGRIWSETIFEEVFMDVFVQKSQFIYCGLRQNKVLVQRVAANR